MEKVTKEEADELQRVIDEHVGAAVRIALEKGWTVEIKGTVKFDD